MTYSVNEVNFISKDAYDPSCQSKPAVYLYYIATRAEFERPQSLATTLKIAPPTDMTDEEMVLKFQQYVSRIEHASTMAKMIPFIRDFNGIYPGYIDDISECPRKYTYTTKDISNGVAPTPDKSLVWDMNAISPTMTGMFFENMIAYSLDMRDDVSDLSACIIDDASNTRPNTIVNALTRNFIKQDAGTVVMTDALQLLINDEPINEVQFRSKYHYMMWLSLIHFMKMDIKAEDYVSAVKLIHYVEDNTVYVDEYYDALSKCTFVQWLRNNHYNLIHGVHIDQKPVRGEMDFISDRAIVDIKAYKSEEPAVWFAQLWLYKNMVEKLAQGHGNERCRGAWVNQQDPNTYDITANNDKRKLYILNVFSNKVYEFKY